VTLLRVEGLSKEFGGVHAVADLEFSISAGAVFSIIGPNGAGKTTLLNLLTGIYTPTSGRIFLGEEELTHRAPFEYAACGIGRTFQNLQVFFNMSALENVMVGRFLHERCSLAAALFRSPALARAERACREEAERLLRFVGLGEYVGAHSDSLPYGALKRLDIARALAVSPRLIVCDEPVSALDVSIQAQVINLLEDLQDTFRLTYVFIAHDLSVVEHISTRIAVMYLGRIVEVAPARELYSAPRHPYTEALLSAVPVPDPTFKRRRIVLQGDVPNPVRPPSGCHFHPRCPHAMERCRQETPLLREIAPGRMSACHLHG